MYKFKAVLEQHGFYNQQYQYCLSRYNGITRIYFFSDVVVKIKQNKCWLLTTFNENVSLGSSIKILNNYLDFNHGKQIIIRENDKFIWTIQKKMKNTYSLTQFKNHKYIKNIFSRVFNVSLDKIIFCYINDLNPCIIVNNQYLIYDLFSENFILNNLINYFLFDVEAVILNKNIKQKIFKNIRIIE